MILRFILHIEKHRGYRWRVSIKRAPYSGQRVYDKGWGWRKLLPCRACSGVGYFDAPLHDQREWIETQEIGTHTHAWIEQNHAADADDYPYGYQPGWPGLHDRDFGPVWIEQTYRDMAVEDGLLPAPSLTETDEQELQRELDQTFERGAPGSSESVYAYLDAPALQDAHGRYPDELHYGCDFPCHEFH